MERLVHLMAIPLSALAAAGVVLVVASALAQTADIPKDARRVAPAVPLKAEPFDLRDVSLDDGPFRHAQELNRKYLLSLPPDRLLHCFRVTAGLPSAAKPLGGWEAPNCEVRGHFVGHYLTACALMVRATGDEQLKKNADAVVAGFAECQAKFPSGYLSAYPEELIDRVIAGKGVWAPWYTLHKLYAGLLDMYLLTGNPQALDVLKKAAAWIDSRVGPLTDDQAQRMLGNEHGGMNDVLAGLYEVTGDPKHLALARKFNHHAVLDPLMRKEDRLTGLHANTQFPKVIGITRQYELTGEPALLTGADFFWQAVTRNRSYVTGSNSFDEHFSPTEKLSQFLGGTTGESCNTYNMLKLTRMLWELDPKAEYADYYERALYNHILASQQPETGMTAYMLPLGSGLARGDDPGHLHFCSPFDSFWCCTGTGVENHAKYGESIYFHGGDSDLYVMLFIASELDWKARGVKVRQETKYPDEATTKLTFTCEKPTELRVHLRHPYWAANGVQAKINGKPEPITSRPGSLFAISRTWKSGDTLEAETPMSLRTEAFKDSPARFAILCGPIVLCTETEPREKTSCFIGEVASVPSLLKPVAGRPLTFTAPAASFRRGFGDAAGEITFVPFFREFGKPYVVYWDAVTDETWKANEAVWRTEHARELAMDARTTDRVKIGDDASERQHDLKGERTQSGDFAGRHWRHAVGGGWFSFQMNVPAEGGAIVVCRYWGSEVGAREFDILVDGQKLATEKLNRNRPDEFFDREYPISADPIKGKQKVEIRFQAHPGNTAGGVFDLRVMRGSTEGK